MTDHNKKLPIDPWSDGVIKPKYGWVYGDADNLGGHHLKYRNLNEPELNSEQKLSPSGSYETVQMDSDRNEIRTSLNPGETRNYTTGGSSDSVDGHSDQNVESTKRSTVKGDSGSEVGNNRFEGTAEANIKGSGKSSLNVVDGDSNQFTTTSGDSVHQHDGDEHKSVEGDSVKFISGNKVESVSGEAVFQVSGNRDDTIDGNGRLKVDGSYLIESDTSITFKVGSSYIIVEPNKITVKSSEVEFIKS